MEPLGKGGDGRGGEGRGGDRREWERGAFLQFDLLLHKDSWCFVGLVVMTLASHARSLLLNPETKYKRSGAERCVNMSTLERSGAERSEA